MGGYRYNSTILDLGTTVVYLYCVRHSHHSAFLKIKGHDVELFIQKFVGLNLYGDRTIVMWYSSCISSGPLRKYRIVSENEPRSLP
jgi:hypothetical protein